MKDPLERYNRHFDTPFPTLEALKTKLASVYKTTRSTTETGRQLGGLTSATIRKWLVNFNIPRLPKGGPNNLQGRPRAAEKLAELVKTVDISKHNAIEIGKMIDVSPAYIRWLVNRGVAGDVTIQRKPRESFFKHFKGLPGPQDGRPGILNNSTRGRNWS